MKTKKDFPPGTKVKFTSMVLGVYYGVVVDTDDPNLHPPPKQPFNPRHMYILFDSHKQWPWVSSYPYVSIGVEMLEKVQSIPTPSKTECNQEDVCVSCGHKGEWIMGAIKCPNCWKVW